MMYFLRKVTSKEEAYQRINYYYYAIDKRDRYKEEYDDEPDMFCQDYFCLSVWDILEDLNWTECFLDQSSIVFRVFEQRLALIRLFLEECGCVKFPSCTDYFELITRYPSIIVQLNNFQNSLERLLQENYSLFEDFEILAPKGKDFSRKTFFVVSIDIGLTSDKFFDFKRGHTYTKLYEFNLHYEIKGCLDEFADVSFCIFKEKPYVKVFLFREATCDYDRTNDDENLHLMHMSFLNYLYMRYLDSFEKGPVSLHEYLYQKLHGPKKILASDFILP